MNKFTKLILTTAVFATSGFATTISGTENISAGALKEIASSDVVLTGTMTLAGSDAEGNAAKLIIDADRILDIQGGTLTYDGQDTYKPEITLNGTMKLIKNGETIPTIKLNGVAFSGESTGYWQILGTQFTPNYIDSENKNVFWVEDNATKYIYDSENFCPVFYEYTASNYSYGTSMNNNPNYGEDKITWIMTLNTENNVTFSIEKSKYNGFEYESGGTESFNINTKNLEYGYYQASGETGRSGTLIYLYGDATASGFTGTIYLAKYCNLANSGYVTQQLGTLDLSNLRTYSSNETDTTDLSTNISGIKPTALGTAKLPFNCKFSNVDLSNVDNVEYTKLSVGESSAPGVDENGIIKKVITQASATYGDYKNDKSLGVTTTADGTTQNVDGVIESLGLDSLASNTEIFNKTDYVLDTTDLDTVVHSIAEDTTYNFGFKGSKSISITDTTNSYRAIFKGDNSEYAPADNSLTLPSTVEFAGDSSLFPVTQTYGKGIFSGEFTNEIPAGKTATFTNGMNLESNHTLNINGKLIV